MPNLQPQQPLGADGANAACPPGQSPGFDPAFRDRLRELFAWRRDVRCFRPDPLPAGVVEHLIEIACLAPSVGLCQPWRFVIVDDPVRRLRIQQLFAACNAEAARSFNGARATHYARLKLAGLKTAPNQMAVFCNRATRIGRRTMPEMAEYSVVTAIYTLWLAARAEGIGMGWVSILQPQQINAILDVPPDWRLIGHFCLGYAEADDDCPALERRRWEHRRRSPDLIVRR
jgi:5,6-dimethylbenzimidazole synthase